MKMTEAQWTRIVIDLAAHLGWRSYHVESSTRVITTRFRGSVRIRNVNLQGVGFPDLVLVRAKDARLIFAELKLDRGPRGGTERDHVDPSDAQKAWLADLESVVTATQGDRALVPAIGVYVWRPAQLDHVRRILE